MSPIEISSPPPSTRPGVVEVFEAVLTALSLIHDLEADEHGTMTGEAIHGAGAPARQAAEDGNRVPDRD